MQEPTAGMWEGQTDAAEMGLDYDTVDAILAVHVDGGLSSGDGPRTRRAGGGRRPRRRTRRAQRSQTIDAARARALGVVGAMNQERSEGRERPVSGIQAFCARSFATSAIPAFAEQFGHACIRPRASENTRANRSETCASQCSHVGIVRSGIVGHVRYTFTWCYGLKTAFRIPSQIRPRSGIETAKTESSGHERRKKPGTAEVRK